jgi:hypothetical protein
MKRYIAMLFRRGEDDLPTPPGLPTAPGLPAPTAPGVSAPTAPGLPAPTAPAPPSSLPSGASPTSAPHEPAAHDEPPKVP